MCSVVCAAVFPGEVKVGRVLRVPGSAHTEGLWRIRQLQGAQDQTAKLLTKSSKLRHKGE